MSRKEAVLAYLDALSIPYEITEHAAVYTIDDMDALGITSQGEVCKNLFLRDAKGKRHFLVTLPGQKRADLATIQQQLGCTKLSFASADRLKRFLGLEQGEVTPLGIINDADNAVELVFAKELVGNGRIGVHPNENTATLWMTFDDLLRAVEHHGNTVRMIEI